MDAAGAALYARPMGMIHKPSFYEFFAGGGMARAGLGEGWQCLFANDFDANRCANHDLLLR
jgi:DNA (cytosine-5)-methyltransferase 1